MMHKNSITTLTKTAGVSGKCADTIMEKLNLKATAVFCRLLEKLGDKQHMKIENEPYMPLTIEQIEELDGENGTGEYHAKLYSLCHYYEQNGDLMQDPEMCFMVIDNWGEESQDYSSVDVIPYMFRQANLAIYEESIILRNGKTVTYDKDMQSEHAEFANGWLSNIKAQGYLRP